MTDPGKAFVNKVHDVKCFIKTKGPPIKSKPRRLTPEKLAIAKRYIKEMCDTGICQRSNSAWSSCLHMVWKKDGSWRLCGDFRSLNGKAVDDNYPLPHIHDFTARLAGCKIFSKIDLVKGYHQIPMDDNDICKTAIATPFGLFEFVRMPFGLKNAAQTFQRLMDKVTQDLEGVYVYIDDVLIASKSPEEHLSHLEALFRALQSQGW